MVWIIVALIILVVVYNIVASVVEGVRDFWSNHKETIVVLLGLAAFVSICGYSIYRWGKSAVITIIITIVVLYICYKNAERAERQRREEYLNWLNNVGIGYLESAPGKKEDWDWAKEQRKTFAPNDGCVISVKFYGMILSKMEPHRIISKAVFEQYCREVASDYENRFTKILINFLCNEGYFLSFGSPNGDIRLLSKSFVKECQDIFEKEGGVTVSEYCKACEKSPIMADLQNELPLFSEYILNYFFRCGIATTVKVTEGTLYTAVNKRPDSKMVRREIFVD